MYDAFDQFLCNSVARESRRQLKGQEAQAETKDPMQL